MKLTREQISYKLIHELEYPKTQIDSVLDKLFAMDTGIQDAFEKWFFEEIFLDKPVFEGFNPKNIWETYNIKPPAVFLLLDWIRREPQEALLAIKRDLPKRCI